MQVMYVLFICDQDLSQKQDRNEQFSASKAAVQSFNKFRKLTGKTQHFKAVGYIEAPFIHNQAANNIKAAVRDSNQTICDYDGD